jgi:class 3 adenylate cyclase
VIVVRTNTLIRGRVHVIPHSLCTCLFHSLDVAACGLPYPNDQHFVTMVQFARVCRAKFNKIVCEMHQQLDSADLKLRIGIHSGPVTAGVLRGKRARFQLFGDTVNAASRMKSNGVPDKIHVSQQTAELLMEAGYSHWVTTREIPIDVKGKGKMQTYFVDPTTR